MIGTGYSSGTVWNHRSEASESMYYIDYVIYFDSIKMTRIRFLTVRL